MCVSMSMFGKAGYALVITLPIISIFVLGTIFPPSDTEYTPVFQPPGWVFGVVWTYVSLALGLVSAFTIYTYSKYASTTIAFYALILSGLLVWLPINHSKEYGMGFGTLLCTAFLTIGYMGYLGDLGVRWHVVVLLPLPFWLVIAAALNGVIYDRTETPPMMI